MTENVPAPLECACHVRDVNERFRGRIVVMLTEPTLVVDRLAFAAGVMAVR